MEYNDAKQLDNLYKQFQIRDNFNKFLHEKNKIDFYRRQSYYKNYTLTEYNTDKSARHSLQNEDIVRTIW